MKKQLTVILLAALLFTLFTGRTTPCFADERIQTDGRASFLCEYKTGRVLSEFNADRKYPIASMVKIMILDLIFDAIADGKLYYDDQICVSSNAASMGGSQAFLDEGAVYKAETLVKSIIIASANDSCVALAETISGSTEAFVDAMNRKADSLGMKNTNFVNCTGLPAEGGYSSARDVSVMMRDLLSHKDYFRYSRIWMEDLVHPSGRVTGLTNTNRLVRFYDGCDGGKTGYTSEAGHCLCATAIKGGMRLISVIVGGSDSKTRFDSSAKLLNYGFANYESKLMLGTDSTAAEIKVAQGKKDVVAVGTERNLYLFGERGRNKGEIRFELPESVKAPVKKGDVIGKALVVDSNGNTVDESNIIALETIEKLSFWEIIKGIVTGG